MANKKIVFLTGTRADYGKVKSLMKKVEGSSEFELFVFITGMHMLPLYGDTYREVEKDGFKNIYKYANQKLSDSEQMDIVLSNTILGFSNYINEVKPNLIVVHGDRLEALAGAIVGVFNNIKVMHIEGGEVTGSVDESIRHAVSKFSHYHLVANEDARKRLIQLGEDSENIFVFGSADIDIMHSKDLPSIDEVKERYDIPYESYGILMYHPVTTEITLIESKVSEVVKGVVKSKKNYVVIYPNNDLGSQKILEAYKVFNDMENIKVFPSMRFEYFLTLLKNSDFIIGNSSSGVREACVYGVPCIDIGKRQAGRYKARESIVNISEKSDEIVNEVNRFTEKKFNPVSYYGLGNSDDLFMNIISNKNIWNKNVQKQFIDVNFSYDQ